MRKLMALLIALLLAISIFPTQTYADTPQSEASARILAYAPTDLGLPDARVLVLQKVLKKYNSPLSNYAYFYVKYADKYGVDWRLLPAISGLESSFGLHFMPFSYNAYGWGGGYIYFKSWEDGIEQINRALKQNYINKGANTVWEIGPIYAESPTWAVRVNYFMQEIGREYLYMSLSAPRITL